MPTHRDGLLLTAPATNRLISLDALRGFDMFWIMGGEGIFRAAAKVWSWPWLVWLDGQLEHPKWHGFAFYDLIFPTFLFLAGAAMPFSFANRLERGDTKADLNRHAIVRGLVLVLLGMIYNGLLRFHWPARLPSVLGRIGLAYMFAAIIALNTSLRGRLMWIAGLLAGYWAALRFIPVPGYGPWDLEPGHTLTDYLDRLLIPGKLYEGVRDPEGLLATVPAIATALGGVVTGQLLKNERLSGYAKTAVMVAAGAACLGTGLLWDREFPINKNLWTSSFALYCAGWDLLFLAAFYLVIDVRGWKAWAFPFVVVGSNSILIYMSEGFIDYGYTAHKLFDGVLQFSGKYQSVLFACAVVLVEWLLLYFLYRKRVFLKV